MWRITCASLAAGIGLGVAARLVMRVVALESGFDPAFTFAGSIEVVAFGALLGTPLAVFFLIARRRTSRARPWLGIMYGLMVITALAAFQPPSARSALAGTPDTPAATAAVFAALFAAWGLALEGLAACSVPAGASTHTSSSRTAI
jgi:hypothetical protein